MPPYTQLLFDKPFSFGAIQAVIVPAVYGCAAFSALMSSTCSHADWLTQFKITVSAICVVVGAISAASLAIGHLFSSPCNL